MTTETGAATLVAQENSRNLKPAGSCQSHTHRFLIESLGTDDNGSMLVVNHGLAYYADMYRRRYDKKE